MYEQWDCGFTIAFSNNSQKAYCFFYLLFFICHRRTGRYCLLCFPRSRQRRQVVAQSRLITIGFRFNELPRRSTGPAKMARTSSLIENRSHRRRPRGGIYLRRCPALCSSLSCPRSQFPWQVSQFRKPFNYTANRVPEPNTTPHRACFLIRPRFIHSLL